MKQLHRGAIYLAVVELICSGGLLQGQTAGSINGQIFDQTQAVIPGAKVLVENTANGFQREMAADGEGRYTAANLPIGQYKITVTQKGFETTSITKALGVGESAKVDVTLVTGASSAVVEVNSQLPLIDPNQGSGASFNTRDLTELPINGRDYARFSILAPGAVARSNFIADLSFNGQHTVHNQFQIDGIDASRVDQPYMANGFERGARLLTGSLETIAEFRAQTGNYRAEYGRASGSYINIATKSGSNQIHGTVLEYLRNDFFDARNFFNTKPARMAEYRFNDFGGSVGGPIRKNKTFYFANYEGSRQRIGITGSGTTPSAALRSSVLQTSPVLAPLISEFPLGTSHTSDPNVDNYTTTGVSQVREDTGSVKLDHQFTDKNFAYVRVNVNDSHTFGPLFGVTPSALGLLDFQNVPVRTSNVAIHDQQIFNPNFVNEFLAGMQRWGSHLISDTPYPQLSITGLTIVPGTRGRSLSNSTSYQISDNMTLTRGSHTIKWGVGTYRIQLDRRSIATSSITYTSILNFINNQAASASYTVGDPGHSTWAYQANGYVQDTWQAHSGLTLDIGLRYDYETPPYDPSGRSQSFSTVTNTLLPAGADYFQANKKDFSPRISLGWQLAPKLVLRSGYGIFFQTYPVGFGSYSVPLNNISGNTTLVRQQIPNLSYPLTQFLSQGTQPLPTVSGFADNKPDIYAQQWNFTLEAQVTPSSSLQVAYVGNHGLNLRRGLNINFFDPTLGHRPIAGFSDVNIETATGQNVYHSLQASWTQRFQHGVQGALNYTWSHAIDDVQDQGLFSSQPQDDNNYRAERGNSSGDTRHNLSYNLVYQLPFGNGQRFLSSASGIAGKLVSGWQISSLAIVHSGIATTVFIGTNTYGNGNFTNQRPNVVANVQQTAANQTINNWLNPAAFLLPPTGTFGNLGRNTVFGPGFAQFDISLLKETPLTESSRLEFRSEIFNAPNHANFAEPNTTFNTASFGRIFSTFGSTLGFGTSRQIQLAMKLIF